MAAPKRKAAAEANPDKSVPAAEKVASLLALLVTKEMNTDDAAIKLDGIGFTAREISALLDVGPNYVNVAKHRKKSGAKRPSKKA